MVRNHPCAILDSKSKDIFSQSDFTNFNSGNIDFKLLKVVNQSPTKKNITINCQAFSVDSKLVAFGDQRGNIHILNLEYNKYWCVKTRGISITAIAFVSTRIVVAATSDKAVLSYDIKTSICVAKMFDFTTEPIIIFDSHPSKPLLICNSGSEAVLLNTNDWNKQKSLDIENGSIKFRNSHLCGRFNDCIFFWDEDDFSLSYKIEDLGDGLNLFDVSSNGQLLVYSLGSVLYVYDIERQIIEHNLDIQNLHVCAKIEFIRGSYIACALAEGIITFVDCSKGKIVNKLRGRHPFRNFSISNCGKYLITTSSTSRHAANMFHVEKLLLTRGNTENRVIDSNPSSIQKEQITDSNPIIEPRTNPDMGTNPQTFSQLLESTPEFSLLKRSDLKQFLNKYGQYPNDYRPLIWKTLLKLPENRRIFESLLNKGLHSAWLHFRTKYPLKSDQDSKILKAVLSCLEHWCPGISEIEFIPAMVFPLSKMHKHDLITMFETIVFFIYNYSDWFEHEPRIPPKALNLIQQVLELHDNKFWTNLRKNGIDLEEILKIGMEDVFVLLLKSNQWKILFDHLITEGPIFLYFWVVAFLLIHQKQVFHCQEPYITSRVLTIDTRVDMSQIIQMAYFLTKNTPDKIITIHKDWKRLSTSEYPLLYLRPLKDMHDIQSQENEVSKSTSNRLQETNTKTEDRKMDKGPITSELKTEDGYNDINRMDPVVKLQIEQGKLH